MIKRLLVLGALLLAGLVNHAQAVEAGSIANWTLFDISSARGVMGPGLPGTPMFPPTKNIGSSGEAIFREALKSPVGAVRSGAAMSVEMTIARAAMSQGLGVAIGIGMTSVAIAEVLNDVRCKHFDGVTGCDDGVPPNTNTATEWTAGANSFPVAKQGKGFSPEAACGAAAGLNGSTTGTPPTTQTYSYVVVRARAVPAECILKVNINSCNSNGCTLSSPNPDGFNAGLGGATVTLTECPASIDASNPANSIPAGAPTGADGKCATGRYLPKTQQETTDKVDSYANNLRKVNALYDAIAQGLSVPSNNTISGPASATGTPTTSTTSSSAGTTTKTRTPSTRFAYSGDTVTATDDGTTVEVGPDGTTTTSTDTGLPPVENLTDCDKYPEIIGCSEYGTPPDEKPEWSTKTVTFTPVDLGLSAQCPAPYVFNVRSWEMKLDYQAACDIAPVIRAGVLALTALGCMLWMFAAIKT